MRTKDQLILIIPLTLLLFKFISTKRKVLDSLHQHKCSGFTKNKLPSYFKAIYINRVTTFALPLSHQEKLFQNYPKRQQSVFLPEDFGAPWDSLSDYSHLSFYNKMSIVAYSGLLLQKKRKTILLNGFSEGSVINC